MSPRGALVFGLIALAVSLLALGFQIWRVLS